MRKMGSNVDDLLQIIKSRSDKLQFASGFIKEAAREKRVPDKCCEDALELVIKIDSFLNEDIYNIKALLENYKQILLGEKKQTSPPITEDDIGHAYGYSMYQKQNTSCDSDKLILRGRRFDNGQENSSLQNFIGTLRFEYHGSPHQGSPFSGRLFLAFACLVVIYYLLQIDLLQSKAKNMEELVLPRYIL